MKATIWNDAMQIIVIILCWALTLIFGHQATGTVQEVYDIAQNAGRLNFDKYVILLACCGFAFIQCGYVQGFCKVHVLE